MSETYTTDMQVEIERLDENDEWNYRIVWGNPLTGESDGEIFANSLKINDFGMATSGMQLSEYQQTIEIEDKGSMVDIKLKRE